MDRRDQLLAARALAAQASAQAANLESALRDPKRHDPIIQAAQATMNHADLAMRIYSDWLNNR